MKEQAQELISIDNHEGMQAAFARIMARKGVAVPVLAPTATPALSVGDVVDDSYISNAVINPVIPSIQEMASRTGSNGLTALMVLDEETGELIPADYLIQRRKSDAELAMAPRYGFDEWDVPTDREVARAVEEVCNTFLYTNAVIKPDSESTPESAKPAKRGPKPRTAPNPFCDYFADIEYEDKSAPGSSGDAVLPPVIEDTLSICSRTTEANTIVPVKQLLRCMRLQTVSTNAVLNCLNSTRHPSQWVQERYARAVSRALRNVIKRMQALEETGSLPLRLAAYDAKADTTGYIEWELVGKPAYTGASNGKVFTEAERNAIRSRYGITGKSLL
ncbi:hypothetical protein C3D70_15185 [Cronobacter sakazakii]|uniref:hypothetical protein n=1 Tax=Cronobacter sakazakii TaxID=28141 RepID=UPI000CF06B9A|nr:hypothetical protein [Cronobacter sakazakii]PPX82819.1 hypothetical protein C3D70_15185 [Cronobacter sakazakii]